MRSSPTSDGQAEDAGDISGDSTGGNDSLVKRGDERHDAEAHDGKQCRE